MRLFESSITKPVVQTSPKYRADEEDANYCYAQLFLNMPRSVLSDIPTFDAAIFEAYRRWKERGSTQHVLLVREQIDRERMISTAQKQKEEVMVLPAPNCLVSLQSDTMFLYSAQQQLSHQPIQRKVCSQYKYSNDDIDRAKTFLKGIIRAYIRTTQSDRYTTSIPLVYPTHGQEPALTDDQ